MHHLLKDFEPLAPDPEVLALKVIVGMIVTSLAKAFEKPDQSAQSFVNALSEKCQERLVSADLTAKDAPEGFDLEKVRKEARDHIDNILGANQFARDRSGEH